MQTDRTPILSIALTALLFTGVVMGAGCAERATDPPIIESVGPPPPRGSSDTLRIATANLWGVSVLGFDWADDIDERFAAMAERLSANRAMLDIVLIQEAWKRTARRALLTHRGVVRNFPYRVDVVDRPGGAGLVILSRFPIEKARFQRFKAQGRCFKFWEGDCISGKGILSVRLRASGRPIWIGDTHLIACYSDGGAPKTYCDVQDPNGDDRWHQIIEARRAIESLVGDNPVLLGGDFNLTRTSRYYPLMTRAAIPSEPSILLGAPSVSRTPISARGWRESRDESVAPKRVDYLWTRPGTKLRWHSQKSIHPIFTEPVVLRSGKRVALSDHPILATEVCLVRVDDPNNECLPFQADTPTKPTRHARH
jgi:hypothetical protein